MLYACSKIAIVLWNWTSVNRNATTSKIASHHTFSTAFFLIHHPLVLSSSIDNSSIRQYYFPELLFSIALEERWAVYTTFAQYFVLSQECANGYQSLLCMHKRIRTKTVV